MQPATARNDDEYLYPRKPQGTSRLPHLSNYAKENLQGYPQLNTVKKKAPIFDAPQPVAYSPIKQLAFKVQQPVSPAIRHITPPRLVYQQYVNPQMTYTPQRVLAQPPVYVRTLTPSRADTPIQQSQIQTTPQRASQLQQQQSLAVSFQNQLPQQFYPVQQPFIQQFQQPSPAQSYRQPSPIQQYTQPSPAHQYQQPLPVQQHQSPSPFQGQQQQQPHAQQSSQQSTYFERVKPKDREAFDQSRQQSQPNDNIATPMTTDQSKPVYGGLQDELLKSELKLQQLNQKSKDIQEQRRKLQEQYRLHSMRQTSRY